MPWKFPLLEKPSLELAPDEGREEATCEELFSQGDSQEGQILMDAFPSQGGFLWQTGLEFTLSRRLTESLFH